MNKIPAGYRLSFYSCDIRQDDSRIIIKEGLSEAQAQLLTAIGDIIINESSLALRDSTAPWRLTKIHEQLYAAFEVHASLFCEEKMADFKEDLGAIMDYISQNMTGYSYDDNIDMRLFNGYKAEYVPEDIFIEDVTRKFQKK